LVEHLTFNQGVTGSSPVWLTIPYYVRCRSGGIGRRARLKIVFRKECRFDPDLRYHIVFPFYDLKIVGKQHFELEKNMYCNKKINMIN
jgi:hypothetical protein